MKQKISKEEFDEKFNNIYVEYFKNIENDPIKLHKTAYNLNWSGSMDDFFELAKNPNVDIGTSLMLFWLGQPLDYWLPYTCIDEVEKYNREIYELLDTLYQNITKGFYSEGNISFDPKDDNSTNWTEGYNESSASKKISPLFFEKTNGENIEYDPNYIEGFPQSHWDKVKELEDKYEIEK